MAKLWQKNSNIDSFLERFSVGEDFLTDRRLVVADCMGSIAHARGLGRAKLLTETEVQQLETQLRSIAADASKNGFEIRLDQEDCHTAIEELLVERLGELGKKIHLGRSRHDQVMTTIRLFARERLLAVRSELLSLIEVLLQGAKEYQKVPMVGRTHLQSAMPSTVGLWMGALAQELTDGYKLLLSSVLIFNQSPLGAAAGYGVPLPLDRHYTAKLMGFPNAQENVIAVLNSRGKYESAILDALEFSALALSRFAQDLILFTLPEFGYFALPEKLTTGSSIMPQKKNPDGLELVRGRTASLSSYAFALKQVMRNMNTGYNRDLQETKLPFLKGLKAAEDLFKVMTLTFDHLEVCEDALIDAFDPGNFATDQAVDLVVNHGMSFRDAYRQVGTNLDQVKAIDPIAAIERRSGFGYPGVYDGSSLMGLVMDLKEMLNRDQQIHQGAVAELLGAPIPLS